MSPRLLCGVSRLRYLVLLCIYTVFIILAMQLVMSSSFLSLDGASESHFNTAVSVSQVSSSGTSLEEVVFVILATGCGSDQRSLIGSIQFWHDDAHIAVYTTKSLPCSREFLSWSHVRLFELSPSVDPETTSIAHASSYFHCHVLFIPETASLDYRIDPLISLISKLDESVLLYDDCSDLAASHVVLVPKQYSLTSTRTSKCIETGTHMITLDHSRVELEHYIQLKVGTDIVVASLSPPTVSIVPITNSSQAVGGSMFLISGTNRSEVNALSMSWDGKHPVHLNCYKHAALSLLSTGILTVSENTTDVPSAAIIFQFVKRKSPGSVNFGDIATMKIGDNGLCAVNGLLKLCTADASPTEITIVHPRRAYTPLLRRDVGGIHAMYGLHSNLPLTNSFLSLNQISHDRSHTSHDHSPSDILKIGLLVPTLTSNTERSFEDVPLVRVLIPSLLKTIEDSEATMFTYKFYIGCDVGDRLYDNSTLKEAFHSVLSRLLFGFPVSYTVFSFDNMKGAPARLWSGIAQHAYADGCDYMYQLNDDLELITPGWTTAFVKTLQHNPVHPDLGKRISKHISKAYRLFRSCWTSR